MKLNVSILDFTKLIKHSSLIYDEIQYNNETSIIFAALDLIFNSKDNITETETSNIIDRFLENKEILVREAALRAIDKIQEVLRDVKEGKTIYYNFSDNTNTSSELRRAAIFYNFFLQQQKKKIGDTSGEFDFDT